MAEEIKIDVFAPIEELRANLLKLFEMVDNTGTGDVDDTVPYNIRQEVKFGTEAEVRKIAMFLTIND
jgi:hypothetical protein